MSFGFYNINDFIPDQIDGEPLTEEQLIAKLPDLPDQKIADLIVANRYLGMFAVASVQAMIELADRRVKGNTFAYEEYITQELNKLPKLQVETKQDFKSILSALKSIR
jgi:hypothetical protein